MNNAKFLKQVLSILLVTSVILMIVGCATPTTQKNITELYEPVYNPNYNYLPKGSKSVPSGYNVGIVNMNFSYEATPANSWSISTDTEKQYLNNFITEFSHGLEKILISKGVTISGPFKSYEEMTYPERSRCSFLVQPSLKLVISVNTLNREPLSEYRDPNGKGYHYSIQRYELTASAEMEYVILDPLTKEKLERHTLKTEKITNKVDSISVLYASRDKNGNIIKQHNVELSEDKDHFGYHNGENVIGKITDYLFSDFMSKIDSLVSTEEFNHLKKYKDELKQKKVY